MPDFQGFWKALTGWDGAVQVFVELLALCDEFSVTLDYNTPVSGGEWVVTVAHFGDRTTFRFPRLDFNARDVYNQLSQRLAKAKKKAEQLKPDSLLKSSDNIIKIEPVAADPVAKEADTQTPTAGTAVISEDPATAGESKPLSSGEPGSAPDSSESKDAVSVTGATEGKSKPSALGATPDVAGESSEPGETKEGESSESTSTKDAPADDTKSTKSGGKTKGGK